MRESISHNSYEEFVIQGHKWISEDLPKGIVVISHGMAETIERYDDFANYLLSNGYFVYGHNHRGHGSTAGDIKNLGILGDDGWNRMKEDLRAIVMMAKSDYPDTKVVVLGHSMGSFLLRDFLLDYSRLVDGVIISGTGFMPKSLLSIAGFIATLESNIRGSKHKSKLMNKMSFGSYNKKIINPKTEMDWLSRDSDMVKKYNEDPYCGQLHSSGFYVDFLDNLKRVQYAPEWINFKENIPLLVLSGDADPVGEYGKGPKKAYNYYKNLGFKASLKLYPEGRHEMLNEINRSEVYKDIKTWIDEQQ